jgi:hypothetical protein
MGLSKEQRRTTVPRVFDFLKLRETMLTSGAYLGGYGVLSTALRALPDLAGMA